jgi:stage V sporulation protein AC
VGGLICCLGQALTLWAQQLNLGEVTAPMFTTSCLIFLGTTLTGIGVYDRIGKYAGAGSAIPVTGFANSVAAPAIEFQREGAVMGVGARLFTLAGPVLAYGIVASVIVGVVYWLIRGWVL